MPNNLVFNSVASQLHAQIYGSDGTNLYVVKTDSSGRLEVVGTFTAVTVGTIVETRVSLNNVSGIDTALTVDTSGLNMYSFFIYNLGNAVFTVNLQISPTNNNAYFIDDKSGKAVLDPVTGSKALLVPSHYLKYTRLVYEATAGSITAEVWFNGKG